MSQQFDLLSQIEAADGEMTEEIQQLLSLNEDQIQNTTQTMLDLRDTLLTQSLGSLSLIEQEKKKIEQNNRTLALIEKRMKDVVQLVGPITVGTRYVAIKTTYGTDVFDAAQLPEEYLRIVPAVAEQKLPDKVKILSALKKKTPIPGAQLQPNEKLEVK